MTYKKNNVSIQSSKLLLVLVAVITMASCSEILIEKDISENTVTLIAPTNQAQFYSTGVTFTWEEVQDATKYRLQIAKPNFNNPMQIALDTVVSSTSFTQQLPVGEYEWKVRAQNESYQTPYSSRTFLIVSNDDFQNNTITLVTPTNNLITNTAAQTLTWQAIIGATSYQLQVVDNANSVVLNQTTANTTYNYTFPEGQYNWKVRAYNGTAYTLYSSRTALIDNTVPNTPTLTSPTNASTTTNTSVTFQWTRTAIAGSAETDTISLYNNSTLTTLYASNTATSPYTTTLPAGTYYWRVKTVDAAGNQSGNSSVFSLTVN